MEGYEQWMEEDDQQTEEDEDEQRDYYTSIKTGSDITGDGTESNPFKTVLHAMRWAGLGSFFIFYVDAEDSESGEQFMEVSPDILNKLRDDVLQEIENEIKQKNRDAEIKQHLERFQKLRTVTLREDPRLPKAVKIRILQARAYRGQRVKIYGWVHRLRRKGTRIMHITLRDGTGFLECILADIVCKAYKALLLTTESAVVFYGTLQCAQEQRTVPGGHNLLVDYWRLISLIKPGETDNFPNEESDVDVQLDHRHIMIRGEKTSKILKMRSIVMQAFRDHYFSRYYNEVTPPTLVETPFELKLFKLKHFSEDEYLTQSSRVYLEQCLPALGNVFCIAQSFCADQICTRRHLVEYTHVGAECPFVDFAILRQRIEGLICDVVRRVLESLEGNIVYELNPDFKPVKKLYRMDYSDVIVWLMKHNVKREDGMFCKKGEEIPEELVRKMTDTINKPIMISRFPFNNKRLYMTRPANNSALTESVDVIVPGIGKILGGSMRNDYYAETPVGAPHGGYELGLERFLCWLLNRHHIRDVCLYPRLVDRCTP